MIASQGRPWFIGRNIKKKAMNQLLTQFLVEKWPKFTRPISMQINWIERDCRRDRDNVSSGGTKILLDAMKQAGLLVNDSRKWIHDIKHDTSRIDKLNPCIEVEIEEVDP